jgi:hypothetical protein
MSVLEEVSVLYQGQGKIIPNERYMYVLILLKIHNVQTFGFHVHRQLVNYYIHV